MRSPTVFSSLALLTLAMATLLAISDAHAVPVTFVSTTNPTGICQSSLPVFDGVIRKRPLAVQNEGDSNAFVTCSFATTGGIKDVTVWFASNDGAAHAVSCTGVSGFNTGSNQFIVKNVMTLADNSQTLILWTAADFAGSPASFPGGGRFSILCNLLPGTGINDSDVEYVDDI